MTKQTINLIGGLVVVAIVAVGLLVGVLPRWTAARTADQDRASVANANHDQQLVNAALAAQVAQLPSLQAQVAALKQQIPAGPHLEQLLSVVGSLPVGAVLRSITPGAGAASAAASGSAATPQPSTAAGFTAVPVTVVCDVRSAADAATVIDALRSQRRLFAVDTASLARGTASTGKALSTLTVVGRVFQTAETAAATPTVTPTPTAEATP